MRRFAECDDEHSAYAFILSYIKSLLGAGKYTAAGLVIWGERQFNPTPMVVRMVFSSLDRYAKNLLQGGGSVSKSYSGIAWHILDYWRDPEWTNIKLISTTRGHASANMLSTISNLFNPDNTIIKMPGEVQAGFVGIDPQNKHAGFSLVAIPAGEDGKARLQGFHPIPRKEPHPMLGDTSRIRVFIDEAEGAPFGLWIGIDNLLTPAHGKDTIKVTCAYNPIDQSSKTAMNAMPVGGWDQFDVEKGVRGSDEWISKEGWHVTRLDPAKTENVVQKRLVFPGFHTYENYASLKNTNDGNSPQYFTMGRGAYPPESSVNIIIPSGYIQGCRGEFTFLGSPIKVAGGDTAVDGRDLAIMTVGRFGKAIAFKHQSGAIKRFLVPRMALQVDQQFEVTKGDTKIVGDNFKKNCIAIGISPEYLMLDATGNGAAVFSYLKAVWSNDVQGVDFSSNATEKKILEEDKYTPIERYKGVVTEVLFALRFWMEFGFIALSPGLRQDPLEGQMIGRRYLQQIGQMIKAEKKDDYKSRLGRSPDELDSLSILLHCVRMRAGLMGTMFDEVMKKDRPRKAIEGDRIEWLAPEQEVF